MNKEKESKVVGFRPVDNVPAGRPYVVAWFDEEDSMHWISDKATNYQIAYFGALLIAVATRLEDEV